MDHTNHAEAFEPQYDIFENSSPQRPITSPGEPLAPDTVEEVLNNSNVNVVNFSRKRELREQRGPYDQKIEHGSKRHRHTSWPAQTDNQQTPRAKDQILSPERVSKFHEGSMRDRPSEKPPSLFTRHFNNHVNASVDELMDEYHRDTDKPLPPYPAFSASRSRIAKSPERKRQTKEMPGEQPTNTASSISLSDTNETQAAGLFKFGKSMASAFNPLTVWSKFTTGWRAPKEEPIEEAHDAQKRELVERQKRAEQAYAELKQAGKLGTQGSHTMNGTPIFTPGYAQPTKDANLRDSGISMGNSSRTSVETSKGSFLLPPDDTPRKSRHSRTPSFQNLKKMASEFNLHRRSASGSRSPEKQDKSTEEEQPQRAHHSLSRSNIFGAEDVFSSLRGSKSKNNLHDNSNAVDEFGFIQPRKGAAKQAKLTKRVSNLEAKLDSARRELDRALGNVPPVPVFSPPSSDRRPLPRPEGRHADGSSGFIPALPTLLSESLLVQPPMVSSAQLQIDESRTVLTADVLHSEDGTVGIINATSTKDEPLQESHTNKLYMHQNEPLLKGEFETSPPAKENVPGTPGSEDHRFPAVPQTPSDKPAFLANASSPRTETPKKGSSKLQKKTPTKKKRSGKDDKMYRPGSEADDDAEWEAAKVKPANKKRKSDEGVNVTPKRSRASRLPVATDSPEAKGKNVLTKPVPVQKDLPPTPADTTVQPSGSLETVHEEVSFTNIIPIQKGSPRKPTAKATPAFPHHQHRRDVSSSPMRSPRRIRAVITPRRSRDSRSVSPPPSSTRGKFMHPSELDSAMVARPNGRNVPELPRRGLDNKSSFEWPDDVF